MTLLRSDGWRDLLADFILPFALGDLDLSALGERVLEVGPGPGTTTELLRPRLHHLTVLELDESLAGNLRTRFEGTDVQVHRGDGTAMSYGDASFTGVVMFTMCHHVPTVAAQDQLFAEVARVLRPGGLLIANDSVASPELAALHVDDVYCPVDPQSLDDRLRSAGFAEVRVRSNDFGWAAHAWTPTP